jgi:hypothetical protein
MRFPVMAALAATSLTLAPACKKKEEAPAEPPPVADTKPAEPPPADTKPAEPPPAADTMLNDMKNCPNAVAGAETKVALDPKAGLTAMVTSKDAAAVKEIQTRAHALLDKPAAAGGEVKHTGTGTGGGALGKCPAVVPDATAKVADTKDGVTITYTAADPSKLPEMQTMIETRVKDMPAAAADGAAPADAPADGKVPADNPATPVP